QDLHHQYPVLVANIRGIHEFGLPHLFIGAAE
ncbi:MAG: hypothetical protein ACI8WB_004318, partial [Phenylobacterium sp.]